MATLYDKLKSANQQLDTAEGIFQDIGLAMVETEMIEEPVLATELADNIRENGGTGDYQKLKNKPTIDGEVLSGEVSAMITALIPDDCVKQPTADQYGDTLTNIGKSGTANVGVGAFKDSLEAWHPFVRLGSDAKSNITIETGSDGKNRLVIGDGGASQYVNQVPLKKDLPTKTSQLTNDSGFITETSPGHFIKWFAPDSEHPDVWYINFGSSSSGGISFVSDSENPTQSYIDVAGNKITAPGYVDPNAPRLMALDDDEEPEDNHLRFNSAPLAFVEEMPENTSDLTNDSGYITEAALSACKTNFKIW